MSASTLRTALRSLSRHRLYAVLNIGGLAIGIAVFLVLALYVRFETGFERWLPDHDKLYIVETAWQSPGAAGSGAYPYTMGGLLEEMRDDFPDIVATRVWGGEKSGSVLRDGFATTEDVALVDTNLFDVLRLPMIRGDGAAALRDPTAILLSESTARKYFGQADPIGRAMTVAFNEPERYHVAGIFRDLPANSDLKLGILVPMPRRAPSTTGFYQNWYHWGSTRSIGTYLRFDTPAQASAFQNRLRDFTNRHGLKDLGPNAWSKQQLRLLPLDRLHLEPQGGESASRKITVATLGVVGVLTLLIAIVNYINLATARAGLRAREVAMRKVLGADRAALIRQFLSEAVLTVGLAALAGLALVELSLPLVNAAGGLSLAIPYMAAVPTLAALALVVGVAAGFYPALLLARYPAAAVLAAARAPGGGRAGTRVRELLVAIQFALAIAFIIGTTVLVAQTRHLRQTDLGFRREGLLVVRSLADDNIAAAQRRSVARALAALPGVESVTLGNAAAGGSGTNNSDNVALPGMPGDGPSLNWVNTGPGFFQTYGARLLAGRLPDDAHATDDARGMAKGEPKAIVINRHAIRTLHFASAQAAIGKTVGGARPLTVIGVVDDMRFTSPRDPIGAAYYYYYREPERDSDVVATVRFHGDPRDVLAAVQTTWQRMMPQVPFDGDTADHRLAEYYKADEQATRMFGLGAALAVLIGCVGLWGLASFNTARRIREIGIRKTLGASSQQVAGLLVGQFLRPVLLANLIAWPLAFVAMRAWLAGFDDQVALSPWYFLLPTAGAIVIAAATVLGQSLRASRATPAWALRHE